MTDLGRCAVHPVRPAVDRCPVCRRPRCAADATTAPGGGCAACGGRAAATTGARAASDLERLVRATLAAHAAALAGGVVAAQYVEAGLFAYVTPFVVGVLCGAAAQSAAGGPRRGRLANTVRGVAVGLAVLGVALGFVLEGSQGVLSADVLVPYALAAGGALLWTMPPQARTPAARSARGGRAG